MSNKSFLHTIVAPNLTDSNFGQSIKTQFDNINTNFQRLVSAAYLSGQDGNDVVVKDVPIYTENITVLDRTTNEIKVYDTIAVINEFLNVGDVNYDFVIADGQENKYEFLYDILQQAVFTDFGLQLVETIFDEQPFTLEHHTLTYDVDGVETLASDLGYVLINEDLEYMFPSYSDTNRYPVWLAFVYSPVVRMFAIHDIDTDTITNICATQLYYFYDARIGSIQLLDDKYSANDFTDYTSFITISSNKNADDEYEINGTYTMSKSQDLPTLYYDNDAQEFCWKMNGIETNITAQGVKGDKGEPAGCWFCRGVSTTIQNNDNSMISANLISYYTTDENNDIILRSVKSEDCEIKNGDFVCVDVYNSDTTNNSTYSDTIFGNVQVGTQVTGDSAVLVYMVVRPYYTSVMSMINNSPTLFYDYLTRISTHIGDDDLLPDTLHGLFIPSTYQGSRPNNPEPFLHAINVYPRSKTNINDILMIHPVDNNDIIGQIDSIIPTKMVDRKPEIHIEGYQGIVLKDGVQLKMAKDNSSDEYIDIKDTLALIKRPVGSKYLTCETSKELYDSRYYTALPLDFNKFYKYKAISDYFKKSVTLLLDPSYVVTGDYVFDIPRLRLKSENLGTNWNNVKYRDYSDGSIKRSVIFEMISKGTIDGDNTNNYYRYNCVFNFGIKYERNGTTFINLEKDMSDTTYSSTIQSYNIFKAMTMMKSDMNNPQVECAGTSTEDFNMHIAKATYNDNGYSMLYFGCVINDSYGDKSVCYPNKIYGNLDYIYDDVNCNVIIRLSTARARNENIDDLIQDTNSNGVKLCDAYNLYSRHYELGQDYVMLSKKLLPVPLNYDIDHYFYTHRFDNMENVSPKFFNGMYNIFNWPNSMDINHNSYDMYDDEMKHPTMSVDLFFMNFMENKNATITYNDFINQFDPVYSMVIKEII